MDFGYDYFKAPEFNLRPEDLNPALRPNYHRNVNQIRDYYSEPPVSRFNRFPKNDPPRKCTCGKLHKSNETHVNLYMLVILLIVITVVQWFIIFFSSSSGPVTINNITNNQKIEPEQPKIEEAKK